jgi:hypothetical protein
MRRRWSACVVIAASLAAPVARARREDPDASLSAKDVATSFAPYVPAVRTCYLTHARGKAVDGTLRLELIIHPNGLIFRFGFAAPGVVGPPLGKLDTCLRGLAPSWRFPERRGYTTAVLPFLFQRTNAPGAGPIESCWDARGCPPGKPGGSR